MKYQGSPFDTLSKELIINILKYLSTQDIGVISRVNSQWRKYAAEDSVWRALCTRAKFIVPASEEAPSGFNDWKSFYRALKKDFAWAPDRFVGQVKFYNNYKTFTLVKDGTAFILGTKPVMSNARSFWEIQVYWDSEVKGTRLIGVATSAVDRNVPLGNDDHGYAFSEEGNLYHRGKQITNLKKGFESGNRIGLLVEDGQIFFLVNGTPRGKGFDIGKEKVLYPAMYLSREHDQASIISANIAKP